MMRAKDLLYYNLRGDDYLCGLYFAFDSNLVLRCLWVVVIQMVIVVLLVEHKSRGCLNQVATMSVVYRGYLKGFLSLLQMTCVEGLMNNAHHIIRNQFYLQLIQELTWKRKNYQ